MNRNMSLAAALVASSLAVSSASAETLSSADFLNARLAAFGKGDLNTMVEQYADDATVITPQGVLQGKEQIRMFLQAVLTEFGSPGVKFDLVGQSTSPSALAIVWKAETAKAIYDLGVETYVLSEGKAIQQTTVITMRAK